MFKYYTRTKAWSSFRLGLRVNCESGDRALRCALLLPIKIWTVVSMGFEFVQIELVLTKTT